MTTPRAARGAVVAEGKVIGVDRSVVHVDVALPEGTRRVVARRCGQMVIKRVRVAIDDDVVVEVNPRDPRHGRILRRIDKEP